MPQFIIHSEELENLEFITTPLEKMDFECPNCGSKFSVYLYENSRLKEKYFKGECEICGYRFLLTPKECQFLQPENPLFKIYYKFHPDEWDKREKERKKKEKLKLKRKREKSLWKKRKEGKLKKWDIKYIKSYTKSRGLE